MRERKAKKREREEYRNSSFNETGKKVTPNIELDTSH